MSALRTAVEAAGMALVAAGVWLAWPPAGVACAGLCLIALSLGTRGGRK